VVRVLEDTLEGQKVEGKNAEQAEHFCERRGKADIEAPRHTLDDLKVEWCEWNGSNSAFADDKKSLCMK
jgi:hypothetical protein